MKLTFLFMMMGLMQISASVYSQTAKLTLNMRNARVIDVLEQIEKQSEFRFAYSTALIDLERKVTVSVDEKNISETLDALFAGTGVKHVTQDRHIMLYPQELDEPENAETKQQKSVSGKVTDSTGQPLPGVTVVVKGTGTGTVTNTDGNYTLSNIPDDAVLQFSFVGMRTQEVEVGSQTTISVTMEEESIGLDEVVAIGYGTQKLGEITGSVSKVKGNEVASVPVASVSQALQGKVAGVSVTNSGSPGSNPIVRVRGIGSVSFNSDPLYVVDGVPTSTISGIDIKDIESINILKDASAAAIYGSRGSNGVIIVATKNGSSNNKFTISLDSYYGIQEAWKKLDLLNREQYLDYGTVLHTNAGLPLPDRFSQLNQPVYEGATKSYAQTDTDWQDEMFNAAPIQQHSLSLSGGNDKSKYYSSFGYFKQDGIMQGTAYERINVRLNTNHNVNKWLKIGETFSVSGEDQDSEMQNGGRTQIQHMIRSIPYLPVKDPTLLGGYRGPSSADGSDPENPVLGANLFKLNYLTFRLRATGFAEINFTDWLKYVGSVGLEYANGKSKDYKPMYDAGGYHSRGTASLAMGQYTNTSWLFTNQLTFNKSFGDHSINAIAVAEQQSNSYQTLNGEGQLSTNEVVQLQGVSSPATNSSLYEDKLISYLTRVQYNYANKYLLSASIRADGSAKFAPENKWGVFKSFSAAWRISKEAFFNAEGIISDLKVKASYGETGFNGIGSYVWQVPAQVDATAYILNGQRSYGSFVRNLGNKDLQWETTNMTNIGVDMSLFNNLMNFSAEYYNRQTDNLIIMTSLAPSLGYSEAINQNIGSMENKGFEFLLGITKEIGELNLDFKANLSTNKNKILKLAGDDSPIYSGANGDMGGYAPTRTLEGRSIQEFYGFRVDGIFQDQSEIDKYNAIDGDSGSKYQSNAAPGDIRFKDISGAKGLPDGKIDEYDREVLGSFIPDFEYGLSLNADYKNFDFKLFLQGTSGNEIYNGTAVIQNGMKRLFNSGIDVLNAWTPENRNTTIPRAVSEDPNDNARTSDRWIEDGSYLRVKTLTLGYTLPVSFIQSFAKGNIEHVRIYISTENLLTITKYSGYDPEIGSRSGYGTLVQGVDYGQYPQPRTFLGGIQIQF